VVLATITDAGRDVAAEATLALNEACFGLDGLTGEQVAGTTAMLRAIRVAVGDIPPPPGGTV
jgi:hypothetical protein